ncbi:hypothetical protein [Aggregatilinea lenta]|uniref:hypothetical protein n=1 Tax=Aggregatilinea lenta TaxID=913108 RepID=UPI0013C31752|nr:hypothetical protein [Aggregatilinea lenta]
MAKFKTAFGEREEQSINWFLLVVTTSAIVLFCLLLYVLVGPLLFDTDPQIIIEPYSSPTAVAQTAPTQTPQPTAITPPTTGPTALPVPQGAITAQTAGSVTTLIQIADQNSSVSSVAFSPDGTLLASGALNGAVRLWNASTGALAAELPDTGNRTNSVAFSADGQWLAAGGNDSVVRLWNVATRQAVQSFDGPQGAINAVAFSAQGNLLVAGSDDGNVYLWDVGTRQRIATLQGHSSYVTSVAFSPDGTLLASGSEDDTIRLWRALTGAEERIVTGHEGNVTDVAFSPDGTLLASVGADRTVRVWDVATGSPLTTLDGYSENLYAVAFSPDGSLLASAAGGIDDNAVRLWSIASQSEAQRIVTEGPAETVAFSPNGQLMAVGGDPAFLTLYGLSGDAAVPAEGATQTFMPPPEQLPTGAGEVAPQPTTVQDTSGTTTGANCVLTTSLGQINVRSGPGVDYEALSALEQGETVQVNGWAQDADLFTWWQLSSGGWVRGDMFVEIPSACFEIPPVQ